MERNHVNYLLVGGGGAAAFAAESIRAKDKSGSILMVGREVVRPYARHELSQSYLRREKSRYDLSLRGPSWYAQEKITLKTGTRVVSIDCTRKFVTLDSGQDVSFDKLLLAIGAQPRLLAIPGASMSNVYYLRTMDDFDRLLNAIVGPTTDDPSRSEMRVPPTRTRVCVIGAGFLGTEVAASLRMLGAKVDVVCGGPYPWHHQVGPAMGGVLSHLLKGQGIGVHEHVRAIALEGDGRAQRVVLSDQSTVACEHVVACVGVEVNREILRNTPIAAEKGILTDEFGRTNVADVFAAGDCAAVFDRRFGKHRLNQHWDAAVYGGTIVGQNMAGGEMPLKDLIGNVSIIDPRAVSTAVHTWGEAKWVTQRIVRGIDRGGGNNLAEIGMDLQGRCVQVTMIGRADERDVLRGLVESRAQVDHIADRLASGAL
jgi:3-phenylpropionate/trans-cinnamate dioxygenase ferredoxin reductase component